MRLEDKIILITGSTTGIGEAMARRFLAEGAKIMFHGRDAQRGKALVAEFKDRAALHVDDLGQAEAGQRTIDATLAAFGRLDAIVNNAAWVTRSTLESTDAAMFDKIMATNVRAPLMLIKAGMPHLKQSRGAVLNIGSINGYCGEGNLLAYSISKGALMTLTRNLADVFATQHVRINHFNVGWVLTPNEYHYKLADGMPKDWPEHVAKVSAPSGRLLRPEEIAAAAVYWVGDESRPISGSVVDVEQFPAVGRNPSKELN